MNKFKKKIIRKYEDYIKDFVSPEVEKPKTLTIADFNARGEIDKPRAPCVVTTIDPDYIKDAGLQRLAQKFRVKTDILRLRDITRNKFMYYSTQEMFLDRQREIEEQDKIYKEAEEFHKFADDCLKKMEADEFKTMLEAQLKLNKLKEIKVADELNQVKLEHQRVLMEVQEVYARFQYLLKLISYFDDTVEEVVDQEADKLTMPDEIVAMNISERRPAGLEQVKQVQYYMEKIVRPYLAKRSHLNAEIWINGYERNRKKVSNYNRRFTHLALLNHIVSILHDKAQKTYDRRITATVFLKDPEFLKKRVAALQDRSHTLLKHFERTHFKDKFSIKLNSIVPVTLKNLQNKVHPKDKKDIVPLKLAPTASKQWRTVENLQVPLEPKKTTYEDDQDTTLAKVEKIQTHAMELLGKLDTIPPDELRSIEKRVRCRMEKEKNMSRRALVKQNRLHNWMNHFKKHHRLQKAQYDCN